MHKKDLLRTIEILFWENAFSDLSMDVIAQRIGIKKPSLYYHFPSKEAMFLLVLEESFHSYKRFLEEAVWEENISEMISKLIGFPCNNQNLFAIVSQKGYCQIEEVHCFILEKTEEIRTFFEKVGEERFGWPPVKSRLFLTLIDSLAKGCSLERSERKDMPQILKEIQSLFF